MKILFNFVLFSHQLTDFEQYKVLSVYEKSQFTEKNIINSNRAAQLAKGMLAFGIFITHGLACYVAIDITWTDYVEKRVGNSPRKLLWEYAVRTLLVLVTCKKSQFKMQNSPINQKLLIFFPFSISFIGCCHSKS